MAGFLYLLLMKRNEIKNLIRCCVKEVLSEQDDNIDNQEIKNARKRVEIGKQKVETERQKEIDTQIKNANDKRLEAENDDEREKYNQVIKKLKDKKSASKAAYKASRDTISGL